MRPPPLASPYLQRTRGGFLLSLHVVPKAAHTEVAGLHGDRLRIRVGAPAVKGAANQELLRFLSAVMQLPRSSLELVHGAASRRKTVRVTSDEGAAALVAALEREV